MAPDPLTGEIKVFQGSTVTGENITERTWQALQSGNYRETFTTINKAAFDSLVSAYQSATASQPYRWWSYNSNYFAKAIVSASGGNAFIPGAFTPAFAGGGVAPRIPPFVIPMLREAR
jgi:hypothetical protein